MFTDHSSEAWPELGGAGVRFPPDFDRYELDVVELAPFANLDVALGKEGLANPARREDYWSVSTRASILTSMPFG